MGREHLKICIFTNHFYPEDFKVNDIAFDLVSRGHDVSVITAIPDYPLGRFFAGYSLFKKTREKLDGVRVFRLPVFPRGKGNGIRLLLNYSSYLLTSLIFTFFHALTVRYDAIFIHATSPATVAFPAVLMKKIQKNKIVNWVLDLWPESVASAGGVSSGIVMRLLTRMMKTIYNHSDQILIGSKGYSKSICEKGNYRSKLAHFPNWAEEVIGGDFELPQGLRDELSPADFVIMFAGNLGAAQDIDTVLDAALLTRTNKKVKWVFVGDGRRRVSLQRRVKAEGLEKTVFFWGRFPLQAMPKIMNEASVLLVSLKNEKIFNLTIPSKVQFYMAMGKPVLAMLNGDGAELISDAKCGVSVNAGDAAKLADGVDFISKLSNSDLTEMGQNGRKYYQKHFNKHDRLAQLEKLIVEG